MSVSTALSSRAELPFGIRADFRMRDLRQFLELAGVRHGDRILDGGGFAATRETTGVE